MKVAITAKKDSLDAEMDPRFGRCLYFMIYDTDTKESRFVRNPSDQAQHGAGTGAVQLIANEGAVKAVSGEFGPKAQEMLDKLSIQTKVYPEGKKISEIIAEL